MVKVHPPPMRVPIVDVKTGYATQAFYDHLERMWQRSGGAGDVSILISGTTMPVSSTDNTVVRFDGITGDKLLNSGVHVDDSDNVTVPGTMDVGGNISGLTVMRAFQTNVNQTNLASAGTVTLLDAATAEQWKVREVLLSGEGTNFSGGDRLLDIKEGSTIFTNIPAATLQTLAAARWGDAGTPFPATVAHMNTATAAGADIVAAYSGGATDYTAGELNITLLAEQVT